MNRTPSILPERNGKHRIPSVPRLAGATRAPSERKPAPGPEAATAAVRGFDRWLVRRALQQLGNPPVGVVLWNGEEIAPAGQTPTARARVHDRRTLLKLLLNLDLEFGDAYTDGRIDVLSDLTSFVETVYRAEPPSGSTGFLTNLLTGRVYRPRHNSVSGSRRNIHHHYDLSNDFYRLWLDEQMVYTCAYFTSPSATLEQAQVAKMDHVCRKVRLRPGQLVIEAGCGWGALARHMARHYGVKVLAFNISHEQIVYARERARAEGLDRLVAYVEEDYRAIKGGCDAFVSVGMLEHVGRDHYGDLGRVIRRCLKPSGLGLIHSIGRNRRSATNSWLEQRIFPGAYMPSLSEIMNVIEPAALSVLDVENLRLHYAETLHHWLRRFEQVADRVAKQFDSSFVRAWRLYLASSAAAFTTGHMQLFQVVFAPAGNNDIRWTRDHVYAGARGIANGPTP
jgi:cyclopropane-fatty-acyl-phospholipid synthase